MYGDKLYIQLSVAENKAYEVVIAMANVIEPDAVEPEEGLSE